MADKADYEHVFTLLSAAVAGQALAVAIDLEIPDLISTGATDSAELAGRLSADPNNLGRLLRGLSAMGLCAEDTRGKFTLTAAGELLRSTAGNSVANLAELTTMHLTDLVTWHELKSVILTGKCAFETRNGVDFFGYLTKHPELYARFNAAMRQGSQVVATDIAKSYDFSELKTVVDIGGGDGALISGILSEHPHLFGILLDTASGVVEAEATLAEAGVADRCTVTAGDFFESVPSGADIYLIKSVLHDWDDTAACKILGSIRRAAPRSGRLLILEPVLEQAGSTLYARLSDLNMMAALGGRERSGGDFEQLCRKSGFTVIGVRRLAGLDLSLIEAVPDEVES